LEYESLLERDWMLLMDFDREVESICEQPLRLRYLKDGLPASHVPDLLVWRRGRPELCDVKSEERLADPDFQAQVHATGRACAEAGVGYRVLSEPDRLLLMNVRWLAGFREPPVDLDGERERMRVVLSGGPSTIAELLSGSWEVALACPVLMNMLWTGVAMLDVGIPIGAESRVGVVEDGGVMEAAWPLAVGGRLVIDGETVFVNAVGGAEVHGFTAAGAPVRFVLMDGRAARHAAGPAGDAVLRAAIVAEAQELADASDVRKMQFRARVASRLARESGEPLELPCSRQTFNRIVDEVLGSTGLFRLPAKSRRSAQSAPSEDLGSLVAERPGEYVAIDTTALDVFAIDPFTFQWVGLDLTAALDVCTSSILAFRLTPFSTQGSISRCCYPIFSRRRRSTAAGPRMCPTRIAGCRRTWCCARSSCRRGRR
jgi:hypothetical protein